MTSTPVITGAMDHWPAYSAKKWRYGVSGLGRENLKAYEREPCNGYNTASP